MYKAPAQLLDTDVCAGRVMAHARLLIKLSRRFEAIAPSGLQRSAHIANYKSGKVVIHADNGAVAAKIRQISQRLCSELSFEGVECSGIEVRVQPPQPGAAPCRPKPKPLSEKTGEILGSTVKTLPEGPLRAALATLLQRAGRPLR